MSTGFHQVDLAHRLFLVLTGAALLSSCGGVSAVDTATTNASTASASTASISTAVATKAASRPPRVGETAPDFALDAISGNKVKLSQVSRQGPVVLVLLRGYPGYQCPLCTVQVGQLIGRAKQIANAKARVLLVYPGPAEGLKARADEFVKGKAMPENFDLLLDPDYTFTNLYGLRWDAAGETAYPSTFVLDRTHKVLYAKVSRSHGDRAKFEDVLAALPK